ncbi:outer membrane protein transport protein [Moraxella sp. FZLJ2107]|uniref:outer membrane protein transport protein n=1 Tax=unclassified Moraxella TaxID=2685852 RepID=UPI0020C8AF57|nr:MULTISPECIES: outer membrane protein transport protein [unclassified Moraxella]UTO05603.1 outer membrane protein transport protein [Moraxella sp. FZLJ2107]UTO22339.1 outer membrane protein transport protein [Moraxella sp. FZLJ2109]
MTVSFGYKALSLAVVAGLAATTAQAAGLDRSGQDVTAFLQDGTYAEAVYTYIDADVTGKDTSGNSVGDAAEAYDFFRFGVKGDINDRFSVGVLYDEPFGAAVEYHGDNNFVGQGADATIAALTGGKATTIADAQANLGKLQDGLASIEMANGRIADLEQKQSLLTAGIAQAKAAGADATALALNEQLKQVEGGLALVNKNLSAGEAALLEATGAKDLDGVKKAATDLGTAIKAAGLAEATNGEGTNVEIRTNNVTALVGAKFGEKRNFQIYGGPAIQRLNGQVHLRGVTYQGSQGYDARMSTDTDVGWVAGIAYSKPEIALKAALTYRSEIEHETHMAETFPNLALRGIEPTTGRNFKVKLPESVNLDFQTGVNPTTLLTAKVRYVPWSDFNITPPTYSDAARMSNPTAYPNGLPIVSYSKDQWSAEVGLGKKLSDKLAVSGAVGYDSGAGNPATSLGPIEGYWSFGLGAKYNVTPEWSVSVGGKYLKFGDATAQLPTGAHVGEFTDNDGFIAGVKLAYQAK